MAVPSSSSTSTDLLGPNPPSQSRSALPVLRSTSNSATSSPQTSRNSSPTRPESLRSNNDQVANTAQRPSSRLSITSSTGSQKPQWPISPRLKSPPPALPPNKTANVARPTEESSKQPSPSSSEANTSPVEQRPPPRQVPTTNSASTSTANANVSGNNVSGGGNVKPSRGPSAMTSKLETVEEGDFSASPDRSNSVLRGDAPPSAQQQQQQQQQQNQQQQSKSNPQTTDSQSDKMIHVGINKPAPAFPLDKRRSASSLASSKTRAPASTASEGSAQNMIVETETVSSIPQNATAVTSTGSQTGSKSDASGTVRTKPSVETIRPKKVRRKAAKKPTPIPSGTNSTKADLFEAKVNSEIEGDTSDSDETFVYESNTPEPRHRPGRHHSRTPSNTSMQSLVTADRRTGLRPAGHLLDSKVRPKRSMKFSTSNYGDAASIDDDFDETNSGTIRASRRPGVNTSDKYHQMGLFNRNDVPLENDPQYANKLRIASSRTAGDSAKSPSSRSMKGMRPGDMLNRDYKGSSGDESTPLLSGDAGSLRNARVRGRKSHPTISGLRHEMYYEQGSGGCSHGLAGCIATALTLLLVVLSASGFLITTTKSLYDVEVLSIDNVLASEQEIMLDLNVQAVNPNIVTITVTDIDINIFAKSRYVGTDSYWRHHEEEEHGGKHDHFLRPSIPSRRLAMLSDSQLVEAEGGVDHGTDPPDGDLEGDPATMLLGRIFNFDSALTFEPSPIWHAPTNSSGEVRLAHPGNRTEAGGSERWERVMQHPFELIVRGILKYRLPLSSRTLTKSVGAKVMVKPNKNDLDDGDEKDGDKPGNGDGDGKKHKDKGTNSTIIRLNFVA